MDATIKAHGKLDVLVNNAGIFVGKGVEDASLDEWHKLVAVNLTGVLLGTRAALPHLKKTKGNIVNLASIAGLVGSQLDPLYSLTKGGVTLFTKSTALEFGRKGYGIRVNSIHPGLIETDMGQQTFVMRRQAGRHQRHRAGAQEHAGAASDRPAGRRRGHRQGHRVPGVGRCELHDRRGPGGRRRLDRPLTERTMRFGLLYEHQLPRPWTGDTEHRLFKDALAQVELADRLGIDHIWEVEHHFLEEYAHSSAPEVFLAACAARTKNIRIGHGVVLAPPGYNHPARVAERIATLDLISDGRVDWGTGESASRVELEGFGIDPEQKKAMWAEAVEQTANMMAMSPYPGFQGKFFSMPVRNVVPKPLQKPHPPIWVACSKRETIHAAARAGIGALTFAFVDPAEAGKWAHEYYDIIKSDQCVPIGHTVNANIAMVTGFSVHEDAAEARRSRLGRLPVLRLFARPLLRLRPPPAGRDQRLGALRGGQGQAAAGRTRQRHRHAGRADQHLQQYQDAGVDQVVFIQQGGRNKHEHICEALKLFADKVMPALKADQAARDAKKQAELAPFIEAALKRKKRMAPVAPSAIPTVIGLWPQCRAGRPADRGPDPPYRRRHRGDDDRRRRREEETGSRGVDVRRCRRRGRPPSPRPAPRTAATKTGCHGPLQISGSWTARQRRPVRMVSTPRRVPVPSLPARM